MAPTHEKKVDFGETHAWIIAIEYFLLLHDLHFYLTESFLPQCSSVRSDSSTTTHNLEPEILSYVYQ